jgi:hypothetical protein
MRSEDKYFQTLSQPELWQRYCGFLDLSLEEFMAIQKELLTDQIGIVAGSVLGRKIMGEKAPETVAEFRERVPITTYGDYEPYLSERQEDALAIEPAVWCHSSGRSGKFHWMPHCEESLQRMVRTSIATLVLASATKRGQVNIAPGFRFLLMLPPAPYTSGTQFDVVAQHLSFKPIPDPAKTAHLEYADRIQLGFKLALKDGVDYMGAIGSVLVRMGEAFSEQSGTMKFSWRMLHPKLAFRLGRAFFLAKRAKRGILPRDLWPSKAILAGGTDVRIYKDSITHYWGHEPYEPYGMTEAFMIAIPSWARHGMVFLPDIAFLEFIPYADVLKLQEDPTYRPRTLLMDEIQVGELYEVVLTHFYGMPLLRYRTKDLIKVEILADEPEGINLPHISFHRRIDDVINLGAMAQIDERTLWQAIADTGVKFVDWTATKAYDEQQAYLQVYIELKPDVTVDGLAQQIDANLKELDLDYRDVETYLSYQPVRVTMLTEGSFQRYMEVKKSQGADLAHLKPSHINPPEDVVELLLAQ